MPDRADIYLICGATGAGKTTHAEALTQKVSGLRFSIDEWMQRLHNPDRPDTDLFAWFYPRVERNWAQMRSVAERLVELGVPAIFDCGLTRKSEREIFASWAAEHGYTVVLHFIDVPPETRWQRVQKRNAEQSETFQFEVTREIFDFMETLWEPPDAREMAALNGVRIPA
jgi:predicted kinase